MPYLKMIICKRCGNKIEAKSPNQKYCELCQNDRKYKLIYHRKQDVKKEDRKDDKK